MPQTEAESVRQATEEADPDLRSRIVETVREHGFPGAAGRLKMTPRQLAAFVARRGIDLVAGLRGEEASRRTVRIVDVFPPKK